MINIFLKTLHKSFALYLTEQDKKVMHCMLAAILHLSQIEFRETEYTSGELDIADKKLVDHGNKWDEYSIGIRTFNKLLQRGSNVLHGNILNSLERNRKRTCTSMDKNQPSWFQNIFLVIFYVLDIIILFKNEKGISGCRL